MDSTRWVGVARTFLLSLILFTGAAGVAYGQLLPAEMAKVTGQGAFPELQASISAKGSARIIVTLDMPFVPMADAATEESRGQLDTIAGVQDALLGELSVFGDVRNPHKFTYVPQVVLTVDDAALQGVLRSRLVRYVQEDVPEPPALDQSVPRIGAPSVWNLWGGQGYKGQGVAVAILDTGVDKSHPFLSGKIVSEACYSSNIIAEDASSVCPGGVTDSTAAGSAMPYAGNCPAGVCDHGTLVAGIAAGKSGIAGSPGPGVAPEASIIAIQVFSRIDNFQACFPADICALSYPSDQIKGLERVYALRGTHTIAAVNMSLGGGYHSSTCDADALKPMIDNLRAAGIATVISSGNGGECGATASPGCISTAVTVGATTNDDEIWEHSDTASWVDLLAPGVSIYSSIPGGSYQEVTGTSAAAPHVTGAWALMKQARPDSSVQGILNRFTSTGLQVEGAYLCSGGTWPRIDVLKALGKVIRVTGPNTAVRWFTGTTHAITWRHNLGPGKIFKIQLSRNGGTTWETIAASYANPLSTSGTYNWTVTGPATTAARVRVSCASPAESDISNMNFTITNPSIRVTAPNTAVNWAVGSSRAITWTHNMGPGRVFTIELSRNDGTTWETIAASYANPLSTSGTYNWTVTGPAATAARVRVSCANPSASAIGRVNFTIANPSIRVTAPNTAVNWAVETFRTITWSHNLGASGTFRIELSRNGGTTWETIAPSFINTDQTSGTYNWMVTGPVTTAARVRVSCASPTASDMSNVNFTIANPSITVTAPNTAVNWAIGTFQAITWSHNLGPDKVFSIELSRDGGLTWETVVSPYTNPLSTTGTYQQTVIGPATTAARVRVSCASLAASDASDVNFTIANPTITVTAPNTAVNWAVGSSRALTWTHNLGAGRVFKIELSRNGGTTWETIDASYASLLSTSGTYTWIVTLPVTTAARVRVSCASLAASDASDVSFTIANPTITVTAPNTAVNWPMGSSRSITWSHNLGDGKNFSIELSRDGGRTWEKIAFYANRGSTSGIYNWLVSGPMTTAGRVRVSCANPAASDMSNVNFTISKASLATVSSPPLFFEGFSDGDFTAPFRTAGEEAGAGEAVPGEVTWTVEPEKGI